jgi:DNA/RNA-binding protein KIN17
MGKQKIYHQSVKKIWKLNGLQKLKYYCQMCEKQCRGKKNLSHEDEHGFKAHCSSESHNNNMMAFAADPTMFMEKHSESFHSEFLSILSTRYRDKRVDANKLYQEIISNPQHVHLNSTKWVTLTGYVKYLGQSGITKVEEKVNEEGEEGPGFWLTYIDRSTSATSKQEQAKKRALIERTEEERERKELAAQMEKAKNDFSLDEDPVF